MTKTYKSDQLIIPIALAKGMAIRSLAENKDISYATLVRTLIEWGLDHDPELKAQYEVEFKKFAKMNDLQLMQMKSNLRECRTKPN